MGISMDFGLAPEPRVGLWRPLGRGCDLGQVLRCGAGIEAVTCKFLNFDYRSAFLCRELTNPVLAVSLQLFRLVQGVW